MSENELALPPTISYSLDDLINANQAAIDQAKADQAKREAAEQAAKLAQLQAIATAAREYFHKTKGLADFAHIEYEDLEAALAALEQETK